MAALRNPAELKLVQQWFIETFFFFTRPVEIIRSYRREDVQPDLVAGLTMAVVALPQAIAFALLSDLPPQTGLYTAIIASIVGALWGSSIHLNTGPTNTTSLLVLSTLLAVAVPGTPDYLLAAALMAVIVGVIRLLMGLARLGVIVNFVSDAVIIGLTAGAGILIFANQLKYLFRLDIPNSPYLFVTLFEIGQNLPHLHWLSLALGVGTIGLIIGGIRISRRLPSSLIAVVVITTVVGIFNLEQHGVVILGDLPHGFPPLMRLPLTDFDLISNLMLGSMAVAMIGLVEATSIARAIATQSGQTLDSNQEFVGQGLANIASGLFSGYTCAGSFTRSAVNFTAGARTPFTNVFAGLSILVVLLTLSPYAAFIPRATLAGVLTITAYGMIDRQEMKRILQGSKGDSTIMVATILATLFLPLQFAVLAGIITSILRFLVKTSIPQVQSVVPDEDFKHFVRQDQRPGCPQLGIINVAGSLYFGAAHHVEQVIRANLKQYPEQRFLLLRLHLVDHCDISGIHMLESVVRLYRQQGGDVFISGLHQPIMSQMEAVGFARQLGYDHFFDREKSIPYIFHRVLEPSVCIYECEHRVFAECQALPKWVQRGRVTEGVLLPEPDIPTLLPSELKALLSANGSGPPLLLIDVREAQEYDKGHIPQAQLLPLRLMSKQKGNLPDDRQIVLVCRIGRRSRMAGVILKNLGYTKVYHLQGGVLAWEAAGYPLAVE